MSSVHSKTVRKAARLLLQQTLQNDVRAACRGLLKAFDPTQPRDSRGRWVRNKQLYAWALNRFQDPLKAANFANWFDGSKVVQQIDEEGMPRVVYHGTGGNFTTFDEKFIGTANDEGYAGRGFYFMSDPEWASGYAELSPTANVMPVYLAIKSPKYISSYQEISGGVVSAEQAKSVRDSLIAQGYDGIIMQMSTGGKGGWLTEYVAFYPSQVKSAIGNDGSFDPNNPDITKAFNPQQPRDKFGRWVRVEEIIEAANDPAVAQELRERVTDPEERAELNEQIQAAAATDNPTEAAAAVEQVAAKRKGRKPIYSQDFYEYLEVAKAKRIKELLKEAQELKKNQERLRQALADPNATDEQILEASGRASEGLRAPTMRKYPQEALEHYDEAVRSVERKIDMIEKNNSTNFFLEVEKDHALAVKRAVLAGKDVPLKVLKRYLHTDWMPNDKKTTFAAQEQIDRFRQDRESYNAQVFLLQNGIQRADPVLEESRQKVIKAQENLALEVAKLEIEQSKNKAAALEAFDNALQSRIDAGCEFRDQVLALPADNPSRIAYEKHWDEYTQRGKRDLEIDAEKQSLLSKAAERAWDALKVEKGAPVIRESTSSFGTTETMLTGAQRTGKMLTKIMDAETHGELRYSIKEPSMPSGPNSESRKQRSYSDGKDIYLLPNCTESTVAHEIGHVIDGRNPWTGMLSKAWMLMKTTGDIGRESWLGQGYDPDEVYAPDEFKEKYVGKWYAGTASEVMSMGVQYLYEDPFKFATESPDHFKFVVGILRGDLFGDEIRMARELAEAEKQAKGTA